MPARLCPTAWPVPEPEHTLTLGTSNNLFEVYGSRNGAMELVGDSQQCTHSRGRALRWIHRHACNTHAAQPDAWQAHHARTLHCFAIEHARVQQYASMGNCGGRRYGLSWRMLTSCCSTCARLTIPRLHDQSRAVRQNDRATFPAPRPLSNNVLRGACGCMYTCTDSLKWHS